MSVILTATAIATMVYLPIALCLATLFCATAPQSQSSESQKAQGKALIHINSVYHGLLYSAFLYPYLSEGDGAGLLLMPLTYPIFAVPFLALTLLVGHDCRKWEKDTP